MSQRDAAKNPKSARPVKVLAQSTHVENDRELVDELQLATHVGPVGSGMQTDFTQIPVTGISPTAIQPKLCVDPPDSKLEREADHVAQQVMRMPDRVAAPQLGSVPRIQRKCAACQEEEEKLQRKESSAKVPEVTPVVQSEIQSLRSSGQPLSQSEREFFEPRFGRDFSQVRVHSDPAAAQSARDLDARAFTIGSHIVFGGGQRSPNTVPGQHLMAHELTHVIQQDAESHSTGSQVQRQANPSKPSAATAHAEQESAGPTFLVGEESGPLRAGQMRKSNFLSQLRPTLCQTIDNALEGTGRTSDDCPYLEHWFAIYRGKSSSATERAIRRYAPESAAAKSASDYISIIAARVQSSIEIWAKSGQITGVPSEAARGALPDGEGEKKDAGASLQFKALPGGPSSTADPVAVQSQLGTGQPLAGETRSRMESAFGRDFSSVRVHNDNAGASLSSRLNARAFTVGDHVAFGSGEYQPGTISGDALIAHELAHVAQQHSMDEPGKNRNATRQLESDADSSMIAVVSSLWAGTSRIAANTIPKLRSGLSLQRCSSKKESRAVEYLKKLSQQNRIEGASGSKDKARQVVKYWIDGRGRFILPARLKALLIKELLNVTPLEDGTIKAPDEDQDAVIGLIKGMGTAELNGVFKEIGNDLIAKSLTGNRAAEVEAHRKRVRMSQAEALELFDAKRITVLRDEFIANAVKTKATGQLDCISILSTELKKLYAGDAGEADVKTAASRFRSKRKHKGRVLGEGTIPNFMSHLEGTGTVVDSKTFRTNFKREKNTRKPKSMQRSAWSYITTQVSGKNGWHFFTMSMMDGFHSVSLFVESRPTGVFLYLADQNFTSMPELLEEGSVAGFRRYDGTNFDDYLEKATAIFWDSFFEKKCGDGGTFKPECDSRTNLVIWKLRRRGPSKKRTGPPKFYTVRRGDTLGKIANRYHGLTVERIQKLNNLGSKTRIDIGQKLRLR